jgi:hypothetical protein
MAIAFAPLSAERWASRRLLRVFAGEGTAHDVHKLATQYGCDVAVVVAQDKVWDSHSFVGAPDYRLAETGESRCDPM